MILGRIQEWIRNTGNLAYSAKNCSPNRSFQYETENMLKKKELSFDYDKIRSSSISLLQMAENVTPGAFNALFE